MASFSLFSDTLLLAIMLFAEAEGEPVEGKIYVALCPINTALIRHISLRDELTRKNRYSGMTGKRVEKIVQAYSKGELDNNRAWKTCLAIATSLINCYYISLVTGVPMAPEVTHFGNWNKVKMPKCFKKLTFVKKVGNHWFYKGI